MFYLIFICILFTVRRRTLIKSKLKALSMLMFYMGSLLVVQMVFPEALITALLPIGAVAVLYINFQDPALQELKHYNEEMITGFATLVESRDASTGNHIKHTKGYVEIILNEMRDDPKYSKIITQDFIEDVLNAAPMHDIGKIAIPDQILCKPTKLTEEEFNIMKTHTTIGSNILDETFADLNDAEHMMLPNSITRNGTAAVILKALRARTFHFPQELWPLRMYLKQHLPSVVIKKHTTLIHALKSLKTARAWILILFLQCFLLTRRIKSVNITTMKEKRVRL